MTSTYPKREKFFAYKVVRLMTKTAAAQEIGPEACWLVTVIAHQEDAKRYSGPVTFWNEQLMPLCGFGGRARLVNARLKAVSAGWLHYQEGGKSRPGKYWTLIPERFQKFDEAPVDESGGPFCRSESERNSERQSDGNQNGNQTTNAHHSSLSLKSISSSCPTLPGSDEATLDSGKEKVKAAITADDRNTADWMWSLILQMQPNRKQPKLDDWANTIRLMREQDRRTHQQIRDLFDRVQRDEFWRKNILSPEKLRAKWDDLSLKLIPSAANPAERPASVYAPAKIPQRKTEARAGA